MTCLHETPMEFGNQITHPVKLTVDKPRRPLHAHPAPHLCVVYAPFAKVRITRYNTAEPSVIEVTGITAIDVPEGTTHGLELLEGEIAIALCIFPKYGPHGLVNDPKMISDALANAPSNIDAVQVGDS